MKFIEINNENEKKLINKEQINYVYFEEAQSVKTGETGYILKISFINGETLRNKTLFSESEMNNLLDDFKGD